MTTSRRGGRHAAKDKVVKLWRSSQSSATKWDRNTICVVFHSLNFLKPVHVQNVHLLPQYTPNNDVKQGDIPSGLLIMECHFWACNIRWTLDFSIPISREHCLNYFFVDRAKTCMTASTLSFKWNFSFFRTDLSTHLAPFNRFQTYLGFLLFLPLLVVVYQIQSSNVVELQQHSPLSINSSVTTYVHRMIISPPCLFKHMNDESVSMIFQCLLDHIQ